MFFVSNLPSSSQAERPGLPRKTPAHGHREHRLNTIKLWKGWTG
jgi:hypothetical protein